MEKIKRRKSVDDIAQRAHFHYQDPHSRSPLCAVNDNSSMAFNPNSGSISGDFPFDAFKKVTDILESQQFLLTETYIESCLNCNYQVNMRERIPSVNIVCRQLRRYPDRIIIKNLLENTVQYFTGIHNFTPPVLKYLRHQCRCNVPSIRAALSCRFCFSGSTPQKQYPEVSLL